MKTDKEVPTWIWDFYQARQLESLKTPTEAIEEVLNYLVELIDRDGLPATQSELERMLDNHLAGDRQKVRRRDLLLEYYARDQSSNELKDVAASRESLDVVRCLVTAAQWQLLSGIAAGHSYKEVSDRTGVRVGSLRSMVSRVRKRLEYLKYECLDGSFGAYGPTLARRFFS